MGLVQKHLTVTIFIVDNCLLTHLSGEAEELLIILPTAATSSELASLWHGHHRDVGGDDGDEGSHGDDGGDDKDGDGGGGDEDGDGDKKTIVVITKLVMEIWQGHDWLQLYSHSEEIRNMGF